MTTPRGRLAQRVGSLVVCGVVAAGCIWPGSVHAQTSRADAIAEQQADKAARIEPEDSPRGELVVERIMSSPLLAGTGGLYPWFGSIYNGTGLAAGVGVLRRGARGSRFNATTAASINGSLMADASWRLPGVGAGRRIRPTIDARWSRLHDVPYYGVGPDTTPDDRAVYEFDPLQANLGVEASLSRRLTVEGGVGYMRLSTSSEHAGAPSLPALGADIDYLVSHAGAMLDWRPSPGYAAHGGYLRGEWRHFGSRGDGPFSFERLEVEAAQLVPFVRDQFGLAFRALATTTEPGSGDVVPFILLPSLGGGDTVRGLPNRRFHDRSRLLFTAEYRWRPSRYLDMALFADTGAVGPGLEDIDSHDFETGYGIGARIHGPSFSVLRIDVAHGREGWRLVFGAAQPF